MASQWARHISLWMQQIRRVMEQTWALALSWHLTGITCSDQSVTLTTRGWDCGLPCRLWAYGIGAQIRYSWLDSHEHTCTVNTIVSKLLRQHGMKRMVTLYPTCTAYLPTFYSGYLQGRPSLVVKHKQEIFILHYTRRTLLSFEVWTLIILEVEFWRYSTDF